MRMEIVRSKTSLRRFVPDVDLKQHRLPLTGPLRTLIDFPGQLEAIDRMNQVEEADHGPHLSPLESTDEMPTNRFSSQSLNLRKRFLQSILAEDGQPDGQTFSNRLDRDGL